MSEPDMSTWRSGEKPTDIVVKIGDRTFNCHRVALTSASGYFRDRLNGGLPEEISQIVIPEEDINADAFENVLKFIYNEVPVLPRTTENVDHLLRAADFLQLPVLRFYKSIIKEMLPYSFMFRVLTFARTSGRECFWHHIADYVSLGLGGLCEAFGFSELPLEDIKLIIELCPLHEDIVVDAVVHWINHSRTDRWRYFNELSRLGMMEGISSPRIKSIVQSIVPDEIPQEEVVTFLDNLERTSSDKNLIVLWRSPIDEPKPGKSSSMNMVEVSINHSIRSRMVGIDPRLARMKRVAFDKSRVYSLNLTLTDGSSTGRGILEFFSHNPDGTEWDKNQLPFPSKRVLSVSHYDPFQMCGLRRTNRIYLCANDARDLYVYDCDAVEWRQLYFEKAFEFDWATITACETNNAVYLLGGDEFDVPYLFALDPSSEEWSDLSQPHSEKYTAGTEMCALNGKLYIYHDTYRAFKIYDPKTNEWSCSCMNPYANLPPTENVAVYGDELWLFSPGTRRLAEEDKKKAYMAYLYRPDSNSWRAFPVMRSAIMEYEKTAGGNGFYLLDAIEL